MYTVLATHGLTRLELYDLLSSNIDLVAKLGVSAGFPPLLLDRIIESFGKEIYQITRSFASVCGFSLY